MGTRTIFQKWRRRIGFGLGGAILFAALILLLAIVTLNTDFGRAQVEKHLEGLSVSGQKIEIDGLSGNLLDRFQVSRLSVRDSQGIWLDARDIEIDWVLLTLLSRTLDLDIVSAEKISILREPILPQAEKTSATSGPSPIRAFQLGDLSFKDIELADGIAGPAAAYALSARAKHNASQGKGFLKLTPGDPTGDRLEASLAWTPDAPMSGKLDVVGSANGLLATLLQLRSGDDLKLAGEATGTITSWTLNIEGEIGGDPALNLEANRSGTNVEGKVVANLTRLAIAEGFTERFGEKVDASLSVNLADTSSFGLAIIANTGLLQATVSGQIARDTYALTKDGMAIDVQLAKPGLALGLDRDLSESLSLKGTFSELTAETIDFEGVAQMRRFADSDWSAANLSGPIRLTQSDQQINIITTLNGRGVGSTDTKLSELVGPTPSLRADIVLNEETNALSFKSFTLQTAAIDLSGQGTLSQMSGTLTAGLAAIDFGQASALTGKWQFEHGSDATQQLSFIGSASQLGNSPIFPWVGSSANLAARAKRAVDGALSIEQFSLDSELANASGTATLLSDGALTAALDVQLAASLKPGLGETGMVTAHTDISGTLSELAFNLTGTLGHVEQQGIRIDAIDVTASGNRTDRRLAANLALTGVSQYGPLSIKVSPELVGANWQVAKLEANLGGLRMEGDASGMGNDIAALRTALRVSGKLPARLPINNINTVINITGETVSADGILTGLSSGPISNGNIAFKATGTPDAISFTAGLDAKVQAAGIMRPLSIKLEGNASPRIGEILTELRLTHGPISIASTDPIRVTSTEDGWQANGTLAGLVGTFDFSTSTERESIIAQAGLANIDLAPLAEVFLLRALHGVANGQATFESVNSVMQGNLDLSLTNVSTPDSEIEPFEANLSGILQSAQVTLVATASGESLVFSSELSLPLLTGPSAYSIAPNTSLGAPYTLQATGRIDNLLSLVLPAEISLAGLVNANFSGDLFSADLTPSGHFRLQNGKLEQGEIGLVLDELNLDTLFGNGKAQLLSFAASGGKGGQLTGSGEIDLRSNNIGRMNFQANQLSAIIRDDISPTVSGEMQLIRSEKEIELNGALTIDRADIRLDRIVSSSRRPTLPVTFRGEEDASTSTTETAASRLKITVKAPGRIFAEGRGLDAELALDATISGSFTDPVISGRADITRGFYQFANQRFELVDSSVVIYGQDGSTELDISAERDDGDVTAVIGITGSPERPVIALSARPQLPEDEILSRALFGRTPTQLSPLETARLASALANLAGGSGFDVLGRLENVLSLDRLDLSETEDGRAIVTTGKYLTDNVYVEVRSSTNGAPGVAIEWEPLANLEIEAATDPEEGQELSINWKRDYE